MSSLWTSRCLWVMQYCYTCEFSQVRDIASRLTIGHEEVSGFCKRAISCQGGGADPHAVVSRLHKRKLRATWFEVGRPWHTSCVNLEGRKNTNQYEESREIIKKFWRGFLAFNKHPILQWKGTLKNINFYSTFVNNEIMVRIHTKYFQVESM